MKNIAIISTLVIASALLAGCGKGGDSSLPPGVTGSCQPGYVMSSQYGCLQQSSSCQANQGLYNGQCVYADGGVQQNGYQPQNPFGSNPYGAPNGGYGTPYPNWGYPQYPGQYPNQYPGQYPGYPYYPTGGYPYPNQNTGAVCPYPYYMQGGFCQYYYPQ